MTDKAPWLTVIGVGEDGADGLDPACQEALGAAEVVFGPQRHLDLLPDIRAERIAWPVPFADGLARLDALRGRRVAVLASGDPFWFGAGSVIAARYDPGQWRAFPGRSSFSLVAARLGWPLEQTACLGLHAAPLTRLRPHLAPGARLIVLLRDGDAVARLAAYLAEEDFGASLLHIFEALGGPRETRTQARADSLPERRFQHPVCAAIAVDGPGAALPLATGLPDAAFAHDGQITKRQVRALTLSALAPTPHEHLWDIGGGAGSVAIEWLRCHPSLAATAIEAAPDRAARIGENAAALGQDRLRVITGRAPGALDGLAPPDAVFVGGGLSSELLTRLFEICPAGTRIVTNAVTLESEALLAAWHAQRGGALTRVEIAEAQPLGTRRGWRAAYPVVQWQVTT